VVRRAPPSWRGTASLRRTAADRAGYRARNGGFVVPGYGWLIRKFASPDGGQSRSEHLTGGTQRSAKPGTSTAKS